MSKQKNDPPKDILEETFAELLQEQNQRMLTAEKGVKLPPYKELGKLLSEKIDRPCKKPYSDKEIWDLMDKLKYKPDRAVKQYVKKRIVITNLYTYPPSLVYVKLTTLKEKQDLIKWCKTNLPNDFVDALITEEGLLLIGQSDIFPYSFSAKYDKEAKENGVRYKAEK